MKVLSVVLLMAAATAANLVNFCPKIQEVDWHIELLLPHRACNKFYQCTHGEPVEMSCPEGLYFSIIKERCEWKYDVECGDRIIINEPNLESEKEVGTTPVSIDDEQNNIPHEIIEKAKPVVPVEFLANGCPVDPEIHWLQSHEKFCNLFYYCVQGERILKRCPSLLHFNRQLQVCDWPRNAGCIERYVD